MNDTTTQDCQHNLSDRPRTAEVMRNIVRFGYSAANDQCTTLCWQLEGELTEAEDKLAKFDRLTQCYRLDEMVLKYGDATARCTALESELRLAFQVLQSEGVTQERAKTVANGIDVLATRYRKQDMDFRALESELARVREQRDEAIKLLPGPPDMSASLTEYTNWCSRLYTLRAAVAKELPLCLAETVEGKPLARCEQYPNCPCGGPPA